MSGQLTNVGGGGGGFEHCAVCHALAAGPCARCRKPLCGDCCVIVTHSAQPWAICKACANKGTSLRSAWLSLVTWLMVPLFFLAAMVVGLSLWFQLR
jgi:hypothetical protein